MISWLQARPGGRYWATDGDASAFLPGTRGRYSANRVVLVPHRRVRCEGATARLLDAAAKQKWTAWREASYCQAARCRSA